MLDIEREYSIRAVAELFNKFQTEGHNDPELISVAQYPDLQDDFLFLILSKINGNYAVCDFNAQTMAFNGCVYFTTKMAAYEYFIKRLNSIL